MEANDFDLDAMTVSLPNNNDVASADNINAEAQGRSWTIIIWTVTAGLTASTTGAYPYTTV